MKKNVSVKIRNVDISVNLLFFLVMPIPALCGYVWEFAAVFASALAHEAGHIAVACLLGAGISSIRILPVGLNAEIDESGLCKYKKLAIYVAGPLVNIAIGLLLHFISFYLPYAWWTKFFAMVNLYLAVFNLLPVLPLDGGRVLESIMSERVGFILTERYVKVFTLVLASIISLLGIVQILGEDHRFNLVLIGIYIFLCLKSGKMEAGMVNIKNMLYRRSRFLNKGVYPARNLAVIKSLRVSEAIRSMDFDRFHIIHVLDNGLNIVGELTEHHVLEAMIKHSPDITFEELLAMMRQGEF
ncbi:stage IV sporulation protein FB [Anaerobacterium chartisolvens]|uniref:Stage IV sporulation protein FB n=1 Tax=Anaerobacterium chartisolvens TaxID=1297424 RepID=A0A369BM83_9FIRM|nr:site-2 protease family protein [Anaerobacterium chartisolvens]RCX20804.1 stage IV sporulation protein FB [Anaerobacterium chartisolvens]